MTNFDAVVFLEILKGQLCIPTLELEDALTCALETWGDAQDGIKNYPEFRVLVYSFTQSIYQQLSFVTTPTKDDAYSILNRIGYADLINAYLDYKADPDQSARILIELAQQVKAHLLEQQSSSILAEQLAPLNFQERIEVADLLAQEYLDAGMDIPLHHLAHELEQVILDTITPDAKNNVSHNLAT